LSILPVDQGIEHSAGASFAPNPVYFDPENIVKLAVEGGCNAVASTLGVLGAVARKYAHRIPFIVKLNHNELLTYPTSTTRCCSPAWISLELGAVAVGATIGAARQFMPRFEEQVGAVTCPRIHELVFGRYMEPAASPSPAARGNLLAVSSVETLIDALLVTGFPYNVHETVDEIVGLFGHFIGRAQAVRRLGSAALDLATLQPGAWMGSGSSV
jgi:hypothetical protein